MVTQRAQQSLMALTLNKGSVEGRAREAGGMSLWSLAESGNVAALQLLLSEMGPGAVEVNQLSWVSVLRGVSPPLPFSPSPLPPRRFADPLPRSERADAAVVCGA